MKLYRPQRNSGCRIHDQYTYFDMRTIVLENDLVRVSILLDKGTEIFEYLYKPKDIDFMWLAENGVQNPNQYKSTSDDPISSFIDYYPGGWQEVFPNGGPTSSYKGAQFGQHGEVAHMPWDYEIVEDTPNQICVEFQVRTKKLPILLKKRLTLTKQSTTLAIEESVENLSGTEHQYMWGQHLAFGQPFLEPGCQINLPTGLSIIAEVEDLEEGSFGRIPRDKQYRWPIAMDHNGKKLDLSIIPEKNTASDIYYITGFDPIGDYSVENSRLGMGMHVQWDAKSHPYLWFWQEFGETKDYPWFGRHYNIGLEPFTSYPTRGLQEAIKNKTAVNIGSGDVKTFFMKVKPFELEKTNI